MLRKISEILRAAKPKLPKVISGLEPHMGVNASGEDSVLVYIILTDGSDLSPLLKFDVEDCLRDAFYDVSDYDVHFRWRLATER